MDKLTSTFPPKRCSQRHLEMISEFAERNGINESEAMRMMIEIGHTPFTDVEIELINEYRKSNFGEKMTVYSHNYAQKRKFYASFTDDILYFHK